MTLVKVILLLLGVFVLLLLFRLLRSLLRFKRSFEQFAEESGEKLLAWQKEVDGMAERWHEYDEAYQEALEQSQGEAEGGPGAERSRGATLGPTGGSPRKPH